MFTEYKSLSSSPNFNNIELEVLSYWKNLKVFEKSVNFRDKNIAGKKTDYIFYDGPPFANGLPHYGHLLTGFVKDTVARYQTQKGFKVERRFGWDCHGLPAEMGAEKELGISGRGNIIEYGIDKFNNHCRTSVLKYTKEWENYVSRQARWVDFENDYKTMDTPFMESVLWAFKQLYDKGLVYQSMRVMPYSWACETPLSNFETRLDNSYRERADKSATVMFKLKQKPSTLNIQEDLYILAWTTTPWTLPSNLALAVGGEIEYSAVKYNDRAVLIATSSISQYKKELGEDPEVLGKVIGSDLQNFNYEPLFDYFKSHENAFRVLVGEFVTEGDGTGIVHLAPGFGEDDQVLCEKENIQLVCPVDNRGKFTSEVSDFEGMQVFDAIDEVIKALKLKGLWLKTEQFIHNYPHCWRTDTPLIFKAVPSWYVEVTKFKNRMVELNQQINWIPGHIKDGVFGNWLENARDWSISRNRFWGTPIPVWMSNDPKYPRIEVYGSIKELQEAFGVEVKDLHKPYIDELTRPNPDDPTGKSMMVRVEDVFDCWFESGSMPYAQVHYPFENKEWFEKNSPADFIVEYVAQTRGWFYTLMVLSTALFDRPPFLNCICHGVILDEKGQKLSKRLNNYADPMDIFAEYGADTLRWLMLSSPVMRGQELLIDKSGNMLKDVQRLVIKPIWNAVHFFTLYANADKISPKLSFESQNPIDKYIISKLHSTVKKIEESMDSYNTAEACIAVQNFFETLNNWYIRRNRPRFWKSEHDSDKLEAYNTLFTCLVTVVKSMASLLPLLSEAIYGTLQKFDLSKAEESVHLTDLPDYKQIPFDDLLEKQMDKVRDICNSGHFIRNTNNIRIRQPLRSIKLAGKNPGIESMVDLIKDELNVKNVDFSDSFEGLATQNLKINFPVLAKRLAAQMKDITKEVKQGNWKLLEDGRVGVGEFVIEKDELELTLVPTDNKSSSSLSSQDAVVIMDLNITEELFEEGITRDFIRIIQQIRKDINLNITDNASVFAECSDEYKKAIEKHLGYIETQTLSKVSFIMHDNAKEYKLGEMKANIYIEKA
ncbi:MAG: isoleucine--tRNA ligase [Alphaproteobacteria bacterium 33-17]|nr:MAG: isoleucine--tRNA ligase [Alphaproteobacteria bacterium 33-17]